MCWGEGECNGILIGGFEVDSANDCLDACKGDKECAWFSYNSLDTTCVLLENCTAIETCDTCLTGQRACSDRKGTSSIVLYYDTDGREPARLMSPNY